MELVFYFLILIVISVGSFWFFGIIFGLLHRPAIYFPLSLAAKMAVCAVFGTLFLMIGGVVLSTLVLNAEMMKRPDYKKWPTLMAGVLISVICIILIYVLGITLAWEMLD